MLPPQIRPPAPETLVVGLGRPKRAHDAPVNPPIVLSSTFIGTRPPEPEDYLYGRYGNPTWEPLEEAIGVLEGSPVPALSYASGMAAVAAALSLVPTGGRIVLPRHGYNGSLALARELAARGTLVPLFAELSDTAGTIALLAEADALWIESPTNPMLEVADIAALCAAARAAGVLSVVDNTFATPLLQRPLELGADLVLHSATKFLGGHSDVLLGAIAVADPALRERLWSHRVLNGAIPGPVEAWLCLRGLRTLAVRLERAVANAGELARRLAVHPGVRGVRYPGLPGDPGHQLASRQMSGFGAILCLEVGADVPATERFLDALRVWVPATSLGGVESLAERRRRYPGEPETVPETMVRLSVGIEHVEDLWADLVQAIEAACTP